jgi:hypothetical protein
MMVHKTVQEYRKNSTTVRKTIQQCATKQCRIRMPGVDAGADAGAGASAITVQVPDLADAGADAGPV